MSHKRKWDWVDVIWMLFALIFLAIVLFSLLTPLLLPRPGTLSPVRSSYLLVVEQALTGIMLMFAVVWIFFLGGTFASFLNVVASRVPQGKSILGSSHCPSCNIPLSFRDNVPLFGWLRNRGRCSKCREPISIRYLLVEIVLGLIFLFIFLLEFGLSGVSLPIREPNAINNWHRMLLELGNDLIPIVGFHLTMICVLFAFVLVELDKQKIPRSILTVGIVIGSAIAIIWPCSILLQWNYPLVDSGYPGSRATAIISLALGLGTGATIGWLIGRSETFSSQLSTVGGKEQPKFWKREMSGQTTFGLSIVGLCLGWQSVLVVGCFWWMTLFMVNTLRQQPSRLATDLPDTGPPPGLENTFIQNADDSTGHEIEQQLTADSSDSDTSIVQATIESKSVAHWATCLAASPHAWLLAIVLIHLSTWRWMNLLR